MKKLTYILPLFIASFLIGCGAEETETTTEEATKESSQENADISDETVSSNTYSIDPSTAAVKWTAFKLAEKVGVDGEFTSFSITGYQDNASSISDMMTGTEITLDVSSTKTGDEARDGKIINSFFGSMVNTAQISATILSMEGEESGKANIEILMNDASTTQELDWTYREDLGMFILQGVVNIPDWNAQPALDALTVVCEEKHKGTGDTAVTWPDVEVRANVKVIVTPAAGA